MGGDLGLANVWMSVTINAPADEVWNTISNFNALGKYLPLITESTMEGSGVGALRTLTLQDGGRVIERLESIDENARTLSYRILISPLPVDGYVSTMKVKDLGNNRCEVEWSSTFKPKGTTEADVKNLIEGIYSTGFGGLKKLHGG